MYLLLAAGVQAVRVVNNAALHVKVMNGPEPIAITGLRVAIAALIVAVITLLAVFYQIWLARQELDAVKTDLANNTAQFEEFMRRPDLTAHVVVELASSATSQNYRSAEMRATVANVGRRTAHNYAIEILVPMTHWSGLGDNAAPRSISTTDDYMVLTLTGDGKPIYPNASPRKHTYVFHFSLGSSDSPEILWRILDDYGTYPLEQAYGKVVVDVSPC